MKRLSVLCITLYLCLGLALSAFAASGIAFTPQRVEIANGERYAQVNVVNSSKDEPIRYALSTSPVRMTEDGNVSTPTDLTKREALAESMITFSPKRSQLGPGEQQLIRIMVRKPADLPDGEYFTYLTVTPTEVQPKDRKKKNSEGGGIKTGARILLGMRIPVVIYHGKTSVDTAITSARFARNVAGGRDIQISLTRTGNMSSIVAANAYQIVGSEKKLVAQNIRIVTYIPLAKRQAELVITDPSFKGGPVLIELTPYAEKKNKEEKILFSKEFNIQ